MNQTPPPSGIFAFLPLFLIGILLFVFLVRIARRKGKSPVVALFAFVPIVNGFYALWLCSLPDEAVLKRLEALENGPR